MPQSNYSMSDRSYSGYGYNRSQGCGCGGNFAPMGGCTLAAPQAHAVACNPAPFHKGCCTDKYFNMSSAYGKW